MSVIDTINESSVVKCNSQKSSNPFGIKNKVIICISMPIYTQIISYYMIQLIEYNRIMYVVYIFRNRCYPTDFRLL